MRTILIAGALAMGFAMPTLAQTANFKCAAAGTLVEYSDSSWTRWIGGQGEFCTITNRTPNGTEATLDWYAPTLLRRSDQGMAYIDQMKPARLWPLAVGKKFAVRYSGQSATGSGGTSDITVSVDAQERVTTKAGAFNTFVITNRVEAIGGSFKATNKQWYAPEPGIIVKFDYSDTNGQSRKGEAVSIKR